MDKVQTGITSITLSKNTFTDITVSPTVINYFFGRNGSGKSTLAEALYDNSGVTYKPGESSDKYDIRLFNQDFINDNFKEYKDLPGVFTYKKKNIEVEEKIREKKEFINSQQDKLEVETRNVQIQNKRKSDLISDIHKTCWSLSSTLRKRYSDALVGYKGSAEAFFNFVNSNVVVPREQDLEDLDELYKASFTEAAHPIYELKSPGQDSSEYDCTKISGYELLKMAIVSSSNTPYAEFIKNLKATDWVRNGLSYVEGSDSKCPFCSQPLPFDFDERIKSLFDEAYEKNIYELHKFQAYYVDMTERFKKVYESNHKSESLDVDQTRICSKSKAILDIFEKNIYIINEKLKEPARSVEIENPIDDIDNLLADINETNDKIMKLHAIAAQKDHSKETCSERVRQHLAYITQEAREQFYKDLNEATTNLNNATKTCEDIRKTISDSNNEIKSLSSQTEGISEAMASINTLLRHSGFEGFSLEEMPNNSDKYWVKRKDGTTATKLSEGERNFIAFLYFYFSVQGGSSSESQNKEKIVIIDDPVSSMDSSALFIVGSLVRQMIQSCESQYTYDVPEISPFNIAQMFILTHNVPFHRDITQNAESVEHYKTTSFFLVKKQNNSSEVVPCIRSVGISGDEKENYNPVRNSYTVLWNEYQDFKSASALTHVMHQILESYFIQLCGYDSSTFPEIVLKRILEKHTPKLPDGSDDLSSYTIAQSLLSCFNVVPSVIDEGLSFIEDIESINHYRSAFRLVFIAMDQDQHYDMMMKSSKY